MKIFLTSLFIFTASISYAQEKEISPFWEKVNTHITGKDFTIDKVEDLSMQISGFAISETGVMIISIARNSYLISTDGGKNWKRIAAPTSFESTPNLYHPSGKISIHKRFFIAGNYYRDESPNSSWISSTDGIKWEKFASSEAFEENHIGFRGYDYGTTYEMMDMSKSELKEKLADRNNTPLPVFTGRNQVRHQEVLKEFHYDSNYGHYSSAAPSEGGYVSGSNYHIYIGEKEGVLELCNGTRLYASNYHGILISRDGGNTYKPLLTGLAFEKSFDVFGGANAQTLVNYENIRQPKINCNNLFINARDKSNTYNTLLFSTHGTEWVDAYIDGYTLTSSIVYDPKEQRYFVATEKGLLRSAEAYPCNCAENTLPYGPNTYTITFLAYPIGKKYLGMEGDTMQSKSGHVFLAFSKN